MRLRGNAPHLSLLSEVCVGLDTRHPIGDRSSRICTRGSGWARWRSRSTGRLDSRSLFAGAPQRRRARLTSIRLRTFRDTRLRFELNLFLGADDLLSIDFHRFDLNYFVCNEADEIHVGRWFAVDPFFIVGFAVAFGVLLDTLLVRTVLVPALVTLLGRRVWWPSALSRTDGAAAPDGPRVRSGDTGPSPVLVGERDRAEGGDPGQA